MNYYKKAEQEQCLEEAGKFLQAQAKKGIFDDYLESPDQSQAVPTDSHLADEFLGLTNTQLDTQFVPKSNYYVYSQQVVNQKPN